MSVRALRAETERIYLRKLELAEVELARREDADDVAEREEPAEEGVLSASAPLVRGEPD